MKRLTAVAAAAVLAAGCADRGVVDVSPQQSDHPSASLATSPGNPGLTVMSWNVYYGTDPTLVLANPVGGAAEAWALLHQTNFPERAVALANAIAAKNPELVGLQEVGLWRTEHPGNFLTNFTADASVVEFDFLTLLMNALEARGVHYVVAAVDTSTDLEVPMFLTQDPTGPYDDIRLTDRDVVLVRKGVQYSDAKSDVYDKTLQFQIFGLPFDIKEGWSSVVAKVGGRSYRFVSTHLEVLDFGPDVQGGQVNELLDSLSSEELPTILVGDFNSDAASTDPSKRASYDLITGGEAGFQDTWLRSPQLASELTCCQNDDLLNPSSNFSQRVDFIFTRNMPQGRLISSLVLGRDVVGDELSDLTASGLWPSDHGGLVASFLNAAPFATQLANVTK